MSVYFYRKFGKEYKKLSQKEKDKFKKRLNLFLIDKFHPILNNHSLNRGYKECRSINIAGDMRAIHKIKEKDIIFLTIDNHNNLYK